MKHIYKATYIKVSQGGLILKVSKSDVISFEIASIYWHDLKGEREVSQGKWVVLGLVKLYFGLWKCVTVDSLFTSTKLAEEILDKTGNVRVR
jgi:hypothetical protein